MTKITFFGLVNLLLFLLMSIALSLTSYAQYAIQHYAYTEDNSNIGSNVCYNWNQLPNGSIYVSGNSDISRFDGTKFYPINTKGRGKAIASSLSDSENRLWCNSFNGDVYYLENEFFIRHPISDELKELTSFTKLDSRFFLQTYTTVYELDVKDLAFKKVAQKNSIVGLFSFEGDIQVIYKDEAKSNFIFNIDTGVNSSINLSEKFDGNNHFLTGEEEDYLFFSDSKKLIKTAAFVQEQFDQAIDIDYTGKVNHTIIIEDQLYVSGMNGTRGYDLSGTVMTGFLEEIQITHFGRDIEGNYLACTSGYGLVLIPAMNVDTYNYSSVLKNEFIIETIQADTTILIHGTNAGKIIYHNLIGNDIRVLDLNRRSEVLSLALSDNKETLYAYCDALFEINVRDLKVKNEFNLTSIKNMETWDNNLVLGSRSSLLKYSKGELIEQADLGWSLSLLYLPRQNQFLTSTKQGLYLYDPIASKTHTVEIDGIETDHLITDLLVHAQSIYFLEDYKYVYKCNDNLTNKKKVYTHATRDIDGISIVNGDLLVRLRDSVIFLNLEDLEPTRILTGCHGLNETFIKEVFQSGSIKVFVHRNSLTIMNGLPERNRATVQLTYSLDDLSTFKMEQGNLVSTYHNNNLSLHLNILNGIRARGDIEVYYKIKEIPGKWKKLDNPLDRIELERLNIGKGTLLIKARNEDRKYSSTLEIPYKVMPPFYLRAWFILVCILLGLLMLFLLARWRITRIRKVEQEHLKKKQLEARTLKAELTAIRSQMNPHFIFNVLTAIQAKVIEGKSDEANENIGDFATLIRNVLEKSGKEFIFLKEEIALMQNYVELENSRLTLPIELKVKIDDEDYFDDVLIPTLITQPIIENSIRHAFPSDHTSKKINFIAQRTSTGFTVELIDNGAGFTASKSVNNKHKSFALEVMKKRITTLSEQAAYAVELSIHSSDKGTSVKFIFTYK